MIGPTVYGTKFEKREAFGWCVKNAGAMRHALSQRLKDMKGVPNIAFQQTDVGAAVDVMALIDQVTAESASARSRSVGGFDIDDDLDFEYEDDDDSDDEGFELTEADLQEYGSDSEDAAETLDE